MSQQLVKKGANGRIENVNPRSWIEAIKDKNTGQTLVEILQGFNMYFLPYNGNTSATRCLVPTSLRKKGLWITYVKYDGNVYTEWYGANEIDDTSWGDSSNWRIGNNTLVGDITISANGNWVINGTETEFKAIGEKGNTPLLRVANNRLQVSYDIGDTYIDVTNNPVYTKFRWLGTTGDTQANNVGRIQASVDEGKTWTNMSNDFTNNLHISRYIGGNESLPTSGIAEGTIYAKGPYYNEGDTLNDNPIYRLWVYAWKGNTLAWQDNGEFTSIAAGVVQEAGNSETEVMSQKAVTNKFIELESEVKDMEVLTVNSIKDGFINRHTGELTFNFIEGHELYEFVVKDKDILLIEEVNSNEFTGIYAFYDKDYNILTPDPIDGGNGKYANRVKAPSGAMYLILCCSEYKVSCINPTSGEIKSLKGECAISYNGYVNGTTKGANPTTEDYGWGIAEFDIVGGGIYNLKYYSPNTAACAQFGFYDSNNNIIDIELKDGDGQYHDIDVVVPNSAVRLIIGYDNTKSIPTIQRVFKQKRIPKQSYSLSNVLLTDHVTIGESSYIKNDYIINVNLSFEEFTKEVRIWKGGTSDYRPAYFEISDASVNVYESYELKYSYDHHLNISKYLQFVAVIDKMRKATVYLYTDGGMATIEVPDFYGHGPLRVANAIGYYLNNACITFCDVNSYTPRIYGDSYYQGDVNRWVYYAYQQGASFLLNSMPGGRASHLLPMVKNDINIGGAANILVWGIGMNENPDVDENTPDATWLNAVNQIIDLCGNATSLILCTIPSVPSRFNEGKNKWIRNSGYRYIDFAAAVENGSDYTWKEGMLDDDEIHPTEYGARVMSTRAIIDVPELFNK